MANFKTHRNIGILSSLITTITIFLLFNILSIHNVVEYLNISNYINIEYNYFNFDINISDNINSIYLGLNILLMISFGIIGSIFPDIDLTTSKPARYMRNFVFLISSSFSFLFIINNKEKFFEIFSPISLFLSIIFSLFFIFLLGKSMIHRGIIHSIPISFLFSIFIFEFFNFINVNYESNFNSFFISFLFSIGFLTHLLLDEIYSVDIRNKRIKSSFGSALKLFDTKNVFGSLFTYFLIFYYLYHNQYNLFF